MKHVIFVLVISAFGSTSAFSKAPEKPNTFLSVLTVGQTVTLREVAGRYEINVIEGIPNPIGQKITEVGSDCVVVEDVAGVTETRIPVYSIKAIVRIKVPKK